MSLAAEVEHRPPQISINISNASPNQQLTGDSCHYFRGMYINFSLIVSDTDTGSPPLRHFNHQPQRRVGGFSAQPWSLIPCPPSKPRSSIPCPPSQPWSSTARPPSKPRSSIPCPPSQPWSSTARPPSKPRSSIPCPPSQPWSSTACPPSLLLWLFRCVASSNAQSIIQFTYICI